MALIVERLSFGYGKRLILEDISFRLEAGELLGLLGPNGSGKTSLLAAIGGLRPVRGGRALLDGADLGELPPRERGKRIAYLPQDTHGAFSITVMDLVLLGRTPHTGFWPGRGDREEAARVLELLGLEELAFRDIRSLSGGERQRALLGRALAQRPRLLLLDEGTSAMDLRNQLRTMALLRQLCREEGLLVAAAIHDLNLALRFCDRLLLLQKGRACAFGGPEVLTPEAAAQVYGVAADVVELNGRRVVLPR